MSRPALSKKASGAMPLKRDRKTGLFVPRATSRRRKNPAELVILGANPKHKRNPVELVILGNPKKKRRRNPESHEPSAAGTELYEDFHGRAPKEVLEVNESQEMPREAVVLGDLVELHVESPHGLAAIKFDGDGVKLASNAARDQLFIVGGRQNIERYLETLGVKRSDGKVRLGKVPYIVYQTRKGFDGFHLNKYEHYLGENTGEKPTAVYDPEIQRLTLEGGNYRVEAPGIIN